MWNNRINLILLTAYNMKRLNYYLVLMCLVICVTSCTQTGELRTESNATELDSKLSTAPRGVNYDRMNISPEQFVSLEGIIFKAKLFPVDEKTEKTPLSWKETEPKVRAFLSEHSSDTFISYYRQRCALDLLCLTNLIGDSSEKALPIISEYLSLLSSENNNSIVVFYPALKRLKTYWPLSKTHSVAKLIIEQAERVIGDNKKFRAKMSTDKTDASQETIKGYLRGEQLYRKYISLIKDDILS